jgi:hypothetical protein
VSVTHFLIPGYVGAVPAAPGFSTPGVVWALLKSTDWVAYDGKDFPLTTDVIRINEGEGDLFAHILTDEDRVVPVVVVDYDSDRRAFPVNPMELARVLVGMGRVCVPVGDAVRKELEAALCRPLACPRGGLRIYEPRLKLDNFREFRRHRYLTSEEILEAGEKEVLRRVVAGLASRPFVTRAGVVNNVDDVFLLRREWTIQSLKNSADGETDLYLWIEEQERQIQELTNGTKQRDERVHDLEFQLLQLEDERDHARHSMKQCNLAVTSMRKRVAAAEQRNELIGQMPTLPETVAEIVELLSKAFAERVVFLPAATRSAERTNFHDPHEAWRCLYAVCQGLPELFFDLGYPPERVRREFESRHAGLSLALTEGSSTQQDNRLMALRNFDYEGEQISCAAHVGTEKRGQHLRVHFHPDQERKMLVIGHCGDHLETAGTRRRKE